MQRISRSGWLSGTLCSRSSYENSSPVRKSEPRIDSSCCFSTAQESDSRSNVSLATQFFQQPARGEPCPHCGFLPKRPPRDVFVADGELGLVTNGRARDPAYDPETRRQWHSMFAYIAGERGYKPGWVAHQYRTKFGTFPPWGSTPEPIPPTPEVKSWVRSRMIAFARRIPSHEQERQRTTL